jgi:hypothetical protein
MTRDDIIRLGHETDLLIYNGDDTSLTIWLIPTEEKFLKFANLVAAAEREECAKLAGPHLDGAIAAAIRARGE